MLKIHSFLFAMNTIVFRPKMRIFRRVCHPHFRFWIGISDFGLFHFKSLLTDNSIGRVSLC